MIFSFHQFSVDTETFELSHNGVARRVEPMVFDLIANFASHPEQVFSREELIETVWKGRIVSDATIATCVKNARRALDDTGENQTFIQTVRGRGFKFTADVSQLSSAKATASNSSRTLSKKDKSPTVDADPSLLILPFRCLSDEQKINFLADGLGIGLETILTRIPLLQISAQAYRYQGLQPQPTPRQIHEETGVDFVVDGSLQSAGDSIAATVQLSNAQTGFRIWAETFELDASVSEAQSRCVTTIVGKLEPQLHKAMYESARTNSDEPTARQLFLEASGLLVVQGWHHKSFEQAMPLLKESAAMDDELALSPALLSLLTGFGSRVGLATDRKTATAETVASAEQALQLDAMDSTVLGYTGCSLADVGYADRGESLLHNAIALNPSNAQALVALGAVHMGRREFPDAVANLSKGIEISPLDSRLSIWGALLAVAQLKSGDVQAACETAITACRRNDKTYLPRVALAAAKIESGDANAALRALEDARRIKPDLSRSQIAALVGRHSQQELSGLHKTAAT